MPFVFHPDSRAATMAEMSAERMNAAREMPRNRAADFTLSANSQLSLHASTVAFIGDKTMHAGAPNQEVPIHAPVWGAT